MIDRRMLAIVSLTFAAYVATAIARVMISYRAVEIGLSVTAVGVAGVSFAVLPILFAVSVGRSVDHGKGFQVMLLGGVILAVSCLGLAYTYNFPMLMLFSALLGIGEFQFGITSQVLCVQNRAPAEAKRALSNLLLMITLGQSLGPAIVGWVGGAAIIPPTKALCLLAFLIAIPIVPGVFLLGRVYPAGKRDAEHRRIPISEILKLPGFLSVLAVSTASWTAQELLVIYLPLIGADRGLPVSDIGFMMALRGIAAFAARFFFPWLTRGKERHVMVIWTFVAAASTAAFALPLPLGALYLTVLFSGFSVGLLIIIGVSRSLTIPSPEARGSASAFRISLSRLGQLVTILLGGSVASAIGTMGIFVVMGSILGVIALAITRGQGMKGDAS